MPQINYIGRPQDGAAWITGASSGIGYTLALELAKNGWKVAATARSADALQELCDKAQGFPGEVVPFPGDVTDTTHMANLCREIESRFDGIALLVANAGIYLPQDGLDATTEAFRSSFDVNLMGTVNVVLPVIDVMKPRGRGQIAVVSSVAGYSGLPTSAAYGASKAGLINMAESLKFDLDLAGIRIQVINPGFVDTPATKSNPFPMPHLITAEEAAGEIVKGLQHPTKFEIAFPRAFVRQLKALRFLPYRAYFALISRTTGWSKKKTGRVNPGLTEGRMNSADVRGP
ncbi:SDR family oxidoreductase [Roseibium sp. MMSF_3544]|uniref:SDR family NAD(P)-dependent oxidoreductase n=1 Tax=unclassified Roseibium TaxID=2629323 RepID=UPI00273F7149|nr:SDR family NAD(P)-dependent oxidoreductase [Roseibium sp. MMSF_3544]